MNDLPIKRNKNNVTHLLVAIPLSQRIGLRQISEKLGLSQQALIRSAIAGLLKQHEEPEPEQLPHKLRVADRFVPKRTTKRKQVKK